MFVHGTHTCTHEHVASWKGFCCVCVPFVLFCVLIAWGLCCTVELFVWGLWSVCVSLSIYIIVILRVHGFYVIYNPEGPGL